MDSSLFSFGIVADAQYVNDDDMITNELGYVDLNGEFKLAQVNSKSVRRYRQSLSILSNACNYFDTLVKAKENFLFSIQLGDIIDAKAGSHKLNCANESIRSVQQHTKSCLFPWFFCIGNNDVKATTRETLFAHFFQQSSLSKSDNYSCSDRKFYYDFIPEPGYRIIVLDAYDVSTILWSEQDRQAAAAAGIDSLHTSATSPAANQEAFELLQEKNPSLFTPGSDWYENIEGRGLDLRYMPYNGTYGDAQMMWLRILLSDCDFKNEKVFVFSHLPVLPKVCRPDGLLWKYDEVLALLQSSHCVQAYIAGHDHDGGYAIDDSGIHHIVPPAPLECDLGDTAFGYISVHPDYFDFHWRGKRPGPATLHAQWPGATTSQWPTSAVMPKTELVEALLTSGKETMVRPALAASELHSTSFSTSTSASKTEGAVSIMELRSCEPTPKRLKSEEVSECTVDVAPTCANMGTFPLLLVEPAAVETSSCTSGRALEGVGMDSVRMAYRNRP